MNSSNPEKQISLFGKKPKFIETRAVKLNKLKAHPMNSEIYGEEENLIKTIMTTIRVSKALVHNIVVNGDNTIVAGHIRWKALKRLAEEEKNKSDSSKTFEEIEVDVMEFSEETMTEEEYLLADNIGRTRSTLQKLCELEKWLDLMRSPKYKHLGKNKNRILIENFGLSSKRTYSKALRAVEHIKKMRSGNRAEAKIKIFFKFAGKTTFDAINTFLKELDKSKPSTEELLKATKKELDAISRDFKMGWDVDEFDDLEAYRQGIADLLDIDLEDKTTYSNPVEKYTYEKLKILSREDLINIIKQSKLEININDYKDYADLVFLRRKVAKKILTDIPDFSCGELLELNLGDLEIFAEKNNLTQEGEHKGDLFPHLRKKVAEHFNVDLSELKTKTAEFDFSVYRSRSRSLRLGRMEMKITKVRKEKPSVIRILADDSEDKVSKLAELLSNIDSDNIDDLVRAAKNSSPE